MGFLLQTCFTSSFFLVEHGGHGIVANIIVIVAKVSDVRRECCPR